jgi:hypothetical protein
MTTAAAIAEFRTLWLPHVTDSGLDRLIDLLSSANPMLIHGTFTRAASQGCLATHVAWNHPLTEHLQDDAGIIWLTRLAKLNPATSSVLLAWDECGPANVSLREALLNECRREQHNRHREWECCISS